MQPTILKTLRSLTLSAVLLTSLAPTAWAAYNSGSTGADGVLSPTVNTEVVLPPSGVLNYTSVNIPVNVTVTFKKNASNTPVYMLVSGDATIAGTIDIRGQNAVGANSQLFLGTPGEGGPGGYPGGRGGSNSVGGAGLGLGGGGGGLVAANGAPFSGCGAGYSALGGNNCGVTSGGAIYGAASLQPLLGGSGGGGGSSPNPTVSGTGSGGGGGGGAILIAASGTLNLPATGKILAIGGAGGNVGISGFTGGGGGGGSGGAIRLVATTVSGSGTLDAQGGNGGPTNGTSGGVGGSGRIRIEGETITLTPVIPGGTRQAAVSTSTTPAPVFVASLPTLAITSVGGVNAPANPTGSGDVVVPGTVPNPVAVTFASSNIPLGNTVKLTVVPAIGAATTVTSSALTGSTASATASVSVTLPDGPSVLQATVSYALTVAMGQALSQFAQGELVESITIAATAGQANSYKLVTVSGKEFEVPQARLAGLL